MLQLTKHFVEQWRGYFQSDPPSAEQISAMVSRGIWISKNKLLYEPDGTQFKLLATYWVPERDVVIKIDWMENRVVTVLTPETGRRRRNNGKRHAQVQGVEHPYQPHR